MEAELLWLVKVGKNWINGEGGLAECRDEKDRGPASGAVRAIEDTCISA